MLRFVRNGAAEALPHLYRRPIFYPRPYLSLSSACHAESFNLEVGRVYLVIVPEYCGSGVVLSPFARHRCLFHARIDNRIILTKSRLTWRLPF